MKAVWDLATKRTSALTSLSKWRLECKTRKWMQNPHTHNIAYEVILTSVHTTYTYVVHAQWVGLWAYNTAFFPGLIWKVENEVTSIVRFDLTFSNRNCVSIRGSFLLITNFGRHGWSRFFCGDDFGAEVVYMSCSPRVFLFFWEKKLEGRSLLRFFEHREDLNPWKNRE